MMKKTILLLIMAFATMHISGQDLKSLTKKATPSSLSSSLIDGLAADQVKKLTKKLNLNESQQEQVSGLVVNQLKSEKFQKMLGSFGTSSLTGVTEDQKNEITDALVSDPEFAERMDGILDDKQKSLLSSSTTLKKG